MTINLALNTVGAVVNGHFKRTRRLRDSHRGFLIEDSTVCQEFLNSTASEVFDLKPTSTWWSVSSSAYNRYTNTVDRQPSLISKSPLAFSLKKRENIPL